MPDFKSTAAGLPNLSGLSQNTRDGLTERVIGEVAAFHRWPFLNQTERTLNWAANDQVQKFPDIFRITSINMPDDSGNYYMLTELSDLEFRRHIELNPSDSKARVWRDAGYLGTDLQIEIYAPPTSATVIKVDLVRAVNTSNIDEMPQRFQMLIMTGIQAYAHPEVPFLMQNYMSQLQAAVAREQDLSSGQRRKLVMDPLQAERWRRINDPF